KGSLQTKLILLYPRHVTFTIFLNKPIRAVPQKAQVVIASRIDRSVWICFGSVAGNRPPPLMEKQRYSILALLSIHRHGRNGHPEGVRVFQRVIFHRPESDSWIERKRLNRRLYVIFF